ncbi:NAC domain-containing protein 74-like isoform X2 [Phragmites australis]|uniref:NAC domain-containing protein 74-like isoform X2 n=1 Tax=Phragmites australis TaxID=29695 RepID=UPI002D78EB72|nr:NAC domain-containing protein 74-like isoform X2 [Phragmites australis]
MGFTLKYPTGSRSNRATIAGYWKSTGKDRAIKLNKRTLGTKKTLVFHEGRPPSGRRTEWIMHEYYIDENECQASPDMKDAFVLCRVTKRNDWALENDNEVGNRNPHLQQLNDAGTSVVSAEKPEDPAASAICAEEQNHVATPVAGAELSNDVAMKAFTADTPDDDNELEAWLEELFDPSFNPVVDTGSTDLSLNEQHAESSKFQNTGSVAPKMEPDRANPVQNETDDTDYLLTEDIRTILYPGVDNSNNGIFLEPADQAGIAFATDQMYSMMGMDHVTLPNDQAGIAFATEQMYSMIGMDHVTLPNDFEDGTWTEELQLHQENNKLNLSNENADTGIKVRRRNATASAANMSPSVSRIKLQVGIKRMVTSNTESVNQTMKFADNSGRLDLMTNVEHRKKHDENDATSVKQSDVTKASEDHSNQGYFRGIKNAFRYSSAGFNILFAVCMIGLAAVVLHGHSRSGISL